MMTFGKPAAVVLGSLTILIGCAANGEDADNTVRAPLPNQIEAVTFGLDSDVPGERLYGRKCAFCHVGRNTGTVMLRGRLPDDKPAQLHERTDLSAAYVKVIVRNGLVNMPPLTRAELSDEELDQIAQWLAARPAE